MEKVLVINGCSHSVGSEISGKGIYDGPECREKSFGALLAAKIGRKPIHLAIPAASNDRIFRTTISWIADNSEKIINKEIDPLFLIHWTGCQRGEFRYENHPFPCPYVDFDLDDDYRVYTVGMPRNSFGKLQDITNIMTRLLAYDAIYWSDKTLCNIIALQSTLKSMNLPYWFGEAFDEYSPGLSFSVLSKMIDRIHFPFFNQSQLSFYRYCKSAGFENVDPTNQIWHLGADAHEFYSKFLYEEFKKLNYH